MQILTNTDACLTRQYEALLETEGIKLEFTPGAVRRLAEIASVNEKTENIGARRLYTAMEKLLEEVSFDAEKHTGATVVIDAEYVNTRLDSLLPKRGSGTLRAVTTRYAVVRTPVAPHRRASHFQEPDRHTIASECRPCGHQSDGDLR